MSIYGSALYLLAKTVYICNSCKDIKNLYEYLSAELSICSIRCMFKKYLKSIVY